MIPSFSVDAFDDGSALRHCEALATRQLVAGERGIWITVPHTNVIERGSLPLVGAHVTQPGAPDAPLFDRAALIVICELESQELFVAPAYPPPEVYEPPAASGGTARTGFAFSLELCDRVTLPRRPGRYMMWMVVRERVSAPVRFQMIHDPSVFRDEEAEAFLRRAQAEAGPRSVSPPPRYPLPRYAGLERSSEPSVAPEGYVPVTLLDAPERGGVRLEFPRVSFVEGPVIVRGSFRLVPRAHERAAYEAPPEHGPDERGPSAVFDLRLIVTASDEVGPQVHALALPSFTRFHPSEARPQLSGSFAFDWLALPGVWTQARTYFVYAMLGGQLSGPHPLALVTRDMVPGNP